MKLNSNHVFDLIEKTKKDLISPDLGFSLDWKKTNHYIGGLRPHELTLFCAPTGCGKTSALATIASHMIEKRIPTFVAPVETGDIDFVKRVVTCLEGSNLNESKAYNTEYIDQVFLKHQSALKESGLYLANYSDRVKSEELIGIIAHRVEAEGVRLVMLDNLNFFTEVTSSQLEKKEMDDVIHNFVLSVKALPVHIILICHPRKTDGGRIESEFDIKGSSTAVQEASNVLLMNRAPKPTREQAGLPHFRGLNWTPSWREFVFKKIRRRGEFVNHHTYFDYVNGRLVELPIHIPEGILKLGE